MNTKSTYTLNILGQAVTIKRQLPPETQTSKKRKLKPKERLHDIPENPLYLVFGLGQTRLFDEAKTLFAQDKKMLLADGSTLDVFQLEAKQCYPNLGNNKAYHAHAMDKFGQSYSDICNESKQKLVGKFEELFNRVNSDAMDIADPSPFLRHHMICLEEDISGFQELAEEGHVFSQFMSGLLLTTQAGNFNTTGVNYLISAYNNRFPRSMDALAEFLVYKKDFLGAVQCCLLACDSGDDSRATMLTIREYTHSLLVEGSMIPLLAYIFEHLLDEKFKSLANKHFPEFSRSKEDEDEYFMQLLTGKGGL